MNNTENAIKLLKSMLPEKVSYANLIGASSCYGDKYVYEDPEPYALELAISALEKQIPKKPKEYEDKYYACKCGNVLLLKWLKYPTELMPKSGGLSFCLCCGQKLDWSVEE